MLWTYVNSDPHAEEIVGTFYEKELQRKKKNQKEFRVEKSLEGRVKVALDLSNYATKVD